MSALDAGKGTDDRQPTQTELEKQESRRQAERRAARLGISAKKTNDAAAGIPFSPDPTLGAGNEPVDTGLGAADSAKQPQAEGIKREEPPGVQPGPNAGQGSSEGEDSLGKPTPIQPKFANFPAELKPLPNWVNWRYLPPKSHRQKWRKVPFQPNGKTASTTDRSTWSRFEECCASHARSGFDGVGFVFDGEIGADGLCYCGIDFDSCIENGKDIHSLAQTRIKRLNTYTERSVSGTGFHCIARAEPLDRIVKFDGVEVYTTARYFTFTGVAFGEVKAAPTEIRALVDEVRAKEAAAKQQQSGRSGSNGMELPNSFKNAKLAQAFAFLDPKDDSLAEGIRTTRWFETLSPELKDEVVDCALGFIAKNTRLLELEANGGNNAEYYKLTTSVARSGAPNAEDIFVKHASSAKNADSNEALREHFSRCHTSQPSGAREITVGTLLLLAQQNGANFIQWKQIVGCGPDFAPPENGEESRKQLGRVSLDDFYAYMPMHNYIFTPSREPWPASSVDARLGTIPLFDAHGKPLLNENGKQIRLRASDWLDKNKPVEQMTWAPGLPMVIRDRLISDGGWIERPQVSCFNLYRPPITRPGNAAEAQRWLDHVHKVFADDVDHIVKWLAHRVQHPHEKINHALVFGGSQGIGKDTLLEPVKYAVGPWNFSEVSPQHLLGRFNGFLKSVILRVNEARDLGEVDRFSFYDHMKAYTAAPPDVLRVDEKNLREYSILNCCGVIITTNHKTDGIYLPADDRRHFVAWSDLKKEDFPDGYWNNLWGWYAHGGDRHVAAYLAQLDISSFDPKAPPPKTPAFWDIVDANRAPEDAELADVLDKMENPDAVTLSGITEHASGSFQFQSWITDRKNRRAIPHRLENCGYVQVRNGAAKDGLWVINGSRQVIYAKSELSLSDRFKAASDLASVK